jgi:hypothetical protein
MSTCVSQRQPTLLLAAVEHPLIFPKIICIQAQVGITGSNTGPMTKRATTIAFFRTRTVEYKRAVAHRPVDEMVASERIRWQFLQVFRY